MKTDTHQHSGNFVNTRMKALFVAQNAKPENVKEISLARLTAFQRGLLVTDGTVTRFIEAYTLTPVEVVLLQQMKQTLSTEHAWLQLPRWGRDYFTPSCTPNPLARQIISDNSHLRNFTHCAATSPQIPFRWIND